MSKLIYIIAGEPSGDILASRLMQALKQQNPQIRFCGVGGETMMEQGFTSLFNIKDLSVMGFWEVLPKLPVILKRMNQVMKDIKKNQPDIIITVDSWGFVSSILKKIKKLNTKIPTVHYVAPQVWAWKKGRAKKAAKLMDHLMTLLPYEPPYFEKHGLSCTFVGHPVIENTANFTKNTAESRTQYGIPQNARVLSILPGSRRNEIKKLAPVFLQVLEKIQEKFPDLFLLIPTVSAMENEIREIFSSLAIPHKIVLGQQNRYEAFRMSEFALAASGTVSLELTACGTPHIIAYKFNYFTDKIVERLAITKYANLINILADKFIIPEFVLANCRVDLITPVVLDFLQNPEHRQSQIDEASIYLQKLKPVDKLPSEKAAEVISTVLSKFEKKEE